MTDHAPGTSPGTTPGAIPDATLAAPPSAPASPEGPRLSRRGLLTYAVSAPVLTLATGVAAPDAAQAQLLGNLLPQLLPPLPLTPPDTVDFYDLGDSLVQTALPTMPLVQLEVGANGRVRLDLPRLESGQGIDTVCGMMVAEELDLPLSQVDVTLADARPELLFNQISGASAAVRCFHAARPTGAR